jgi:hypothetical protein
MFWLLRICHFEVKGCRESAAFLQNALIPDELSMQSVDYALFIAVLFSV